MNQRASLYIQTLVQYGSITRAADKLYITPSALSKYISALEKEAGSALFSRIGNHFVLTYAGERYLDWCQRFDALSGQMENEMRDLSNQTSGKIRIGTQTTISDILIERVMPSFQEKYPHICVSITEDVSSHILEQTKQFQLDAAISTRHPAAEQFYQEALISLEQVLLVPEEHPLVKRAITKPGHPHPWVDLSWCRGERFIMMHPGQNPRKASEQFLAPIMDDIEIVMEVRNMRTMIEAVEKRIGIIQTVAGLDQIYSNKWSDLVKLSFGEDNPPTTYWLYHYKDLYRSNALNEFLSIARKQFQSFDKNRK